MMDWTFGGMKVVESTYAGTFAPNRVHEHKDGQRLSYHNRIQKKWRKRFGVYLIPGAFRMGDTIVAHPEILKKLRTLTDRP